MRSVNNSPEVQFQSNQALPPAASEASKAAINAKVDGLAGSCISSLRKISETFKKPFKSHNFRPFIVGKKLAAVREGIVKEVKLDELKRHVINIDDQLTSLQLTSLQKVSAFAEKKFALIVNTFIESSAKRSVGDVGKMAQGAVNKLFGGDESTGETESSKTRSDAVNGEGERSSTLGELARKVKKGITGAPNKIGAAAGRVGKMAQDAVNKLFGRGTEETSGRSKAETVQSSKISNIDSNFKAEFKGKSNRDSSNGIKTTTSDLNTFIDPKTIQSQQEAVIVALTKEIDGQSLEELYQSEEKNPPSGDHILLAKGFRAASEKKVSYKTDVEGERARKLAKDLGISLVSAREALLKKSSNIEVSIKTKWEESNPEYKTARDQLRLISNQLIKEEDPSFTKEQINDSLEKLIKNKECLNTSSCLIDLFNILENKGKLGLDNPTIQKLHTAIRFGLRRVNTAHIYSLRELAATKFPLSLKLFYNIKTPDDKVSVDELQKMNRLEAGIKLAQEDISLLEKLKSSSHSEESIVKELDQLKCTNLKYWLKKYPEDPNLTREQRFDMVIRQLNNVIGLQNQWLSSLRQGDQVFIPGYFHATQDDSFSSLLTNHIEVRGGAVPRSYRGAFVSKKPALGYGTALFGFTEEMQWRHRAQETNFENTEVWSGFNKPIPINPHKTELNQKFVNLLSEKFNKRIDESSKIDPRFKPFIKKSLERKLAGSFDVGYNPAKNHWELQTMGKQRIRVDSARAATPLTSQEEIQAKTKEILESLAKDFSGSQKISSFFTNLSKQSISLPEIQNFVQSLETAKAFSENTQRNVNFCVIGIDDKDPVLKEMLVNRVGKGTKTLTELREDMRKVGLDPENIPMFSLTEMMIFSEYDQLDKVAYPNFHSRLFDQDF